MKKEKIIRVIRVIRGAKLSLLIGKCSEFTIYRV